jgi:hypothetical protein
MLDAQRYGMNNTELYPVWHQRFKISYFAWDYERSAAIWCSLISDDLTCLVGRYFNLIDCALKLCFCFIKLSAMSKAFNLATLKSIQGKLEN